VTEPNNDRGNYGDCFIKRRAGLYAPKALPEDNILCELQASACLRAAKPRTHIFLRNVKMLLYNGSIAATTKAMIASITGVDSILFSCDH
jgi:hypothetical protein